ncbi:11334_t:CDS:2, partial [Dentiscutata heterogama]
IPSMSYQHILSITDPPYLTGCFTTQDSVRVLPLLPRNDHKKKYLVITPHIITKLSVKALA